VLKEIVELYIVTMGLFCSEHTMLGCTDMTTKWYQWRDSGTAVAAELWFE